MIYLGTDLCFFSVYFNFGEWRFNKKMDWPGFELAPVPGVPKNICNFAKALFNFESKYINEME